MVDNCNRGAATRFDGPLKQAIPVLFWFDPDALTETGITWTGTISYFKQILGSEERSWVSWSLKLRNVAVVRILTQMQVLDILGFGLHWAFIFRTCRTVICLLQEGFS